MTDRPAIRLDETDTVATLLDDTTAGDIVVIDNTALELVENIPFGHKVALADHEAGEPVRKYGEVIGTTTQRINHGEWVHTHNCESTRGKAEGRQ